MSEEHSQVILKKVISMMITTITILVGTISFLYFQDRADLLECLHETRARVENCEEDRLYLREKMEGIEVSIVKKEMVLEAMREHLLAVKNKS